MWELCANWLLQENGSRIFIQMGKEQTVVGVWESFWSGLWAKGLVTGLLSKRATPTHTCRVFATSVAISAWLASVYHNPSHPIVSYLLEADSCGSGTRLPLTWSVEHNQPKTGIGVCGVFIFWEVHIELAVFNQGICPNQIVFSIYELIHDDHLRGKQKRLDAFRALENNFVSSLCVQEVVLSLLDTYKKQNALFAERSTNSVGSLGAQCPEWQCICNW